MRDNDLQLLTHGDFLLTHASDLGDAPERTERFAVLRTEHELVRQGIDAVTEAMRVQRERRAEMKRDERQLRLRLGLLAEAISRARLGRVNNPFGRVGGAKLSEIARWNVHGQIQLIRQGMARIAAINPPAYVVQAMEACKQQCLQLEASANVWASARQARRNVGKSLTETRRRWRKALRAIQLACGAVPGYWPGVYWPDELEPMKVFFDTAEDAGRQAVRDRHAAKEAERQAAWAEVQRRWDRILGRVPQAVQTPQAEPVPALQAEQQPGSQAEPRPEVAPVPNPPLLRVV